jgi:hypothetical protein
MKFYWLVLGALTVWRVTFLLQAEDGPWDIVIRLRQFVGEGFWGKLMDCFHCLSVWVAAPVAVLVGKNWLERALLWPSFSAAAILLERVTNEAWHISPAPFAEDPAKEEKDGMLRTKKTANENPGDTSSPGERTG